jgi:hypothetical protein
MTDFYGVNNTLSQQNVPSEKIGPGEQSGRLRVAYDSYTFSAALTTSDALYMMKIPKGARVIDVIVDSDDLGTTGDLNIGWEASPELDSSGSAVEAADADGFFAALDVNAAALVTSINKVGTSTAGYLKKFDAEVQVVIVPSENTTATSGSIALTVLYVVE